MLCKKCKTAVAETERRCPYCGAKPNRGRKAKQTVGLAVACLVLGMCGTYMYMDSAGLLSADAEDMALALPVESFAPTPPAASEALLVATPAPISDLQKDISEVWLMLEAAYKGAMLYTEAFAEERPYISRNGYAYDMRAEAFLTAQDLIDAALLDEAFAGERILLLYIRPADTADFTEISLGGSTALSLFAAYETKDGVALVGTGSARGVMFRESMHELFARYAVSETVIKRPTADTAEYKDILAAIADEEETGAAYDVRFMAADEEFAFVVVSRPDAAHQLLPFALEWGEAGWQVLPCHFSPDRHVAEEVNHIVPRMNLRLLPEFLMDGDIRLNPSADYEFIADYMLEAGTITQADMPVAFASGNDEMLYMVLASGRAFLGRYNGETGWEMLPVQNWMEAEMQMRGVSKTPPLYIIRQE